MGLAWPGFGSGGWYRAGFYEKMLEASLMSSRASATNSRMDLLATSEPISDTGGASGIADWKRWAKNLQNTTAAKEESENM